MARAESGARLGGSLRGVIVRRPAVGLQHVGHVALLACGLKRELVGLVAAPDLEQPAGRADVALLLGEREGGFGVLAEKERLAG